MAQFTNHCYAFWFVVLAVWPGGSTDLFYLLVRV